MKCLADKVWGILTSSRCLSRQIHYSRPDQVGHRGLVPKQLLSPAQARDVGQIVDHVTARIRLGLLLHLVPVIWWAGCIGVDDEHCAITHRARAIEHLVNSVGVGFQSGAGIRDGINGLDERFECINLLVVSCKHLVERRAAARNTPLELDTRLASKPLLHDVRQLVGQ